jgi:anti-anti-sigma regulatory factor
MLRISAAPQTHEHVRLRLEGQLSGEWVVECARACQQIHARGLRIQFDLTDVSFLDEPGVKLLRDMCAAGDVMVAASPFARAALGIRQV